jgi:hypothetical protein
MDSSDIKTGSFGMSTNLAGQNVSDRIFDLFLLAAWTVTIPLMVYIWFMIIWNIIYEIKLLL